MKNYLTLFLFTIITQTVNAQSTIIDNLRNNGKMGVVIIIIATIFVGIILYLITLDKKISDLENK